MLPQQLPSLLPPHRGCPSRSYERVLAALPGYHHPFYILLCDPVIHPLCHPLQPPPPGWTPHSLIRGVPHALCHLLSVTIKPQSITVYLYGVRNLHLENGFPCPLRGALQLRRLLRGIKRVKGLSPDSHLPITPSLLRQLFFLPTTTILCFGRPSYWHFLAS